ncbi:MAG: peptide MFS transporter [Gemmatimonadales bacterium]
MNLPRQTGFFGHPAGLRTLFFAELWERFSFYGMRVLLTLFMVAPLTDGGLGWSPSKSGAVYALYASLVYIAALPGGWIADRVLGARRSVFIGGCIIMSGHIALAVPSLPTFFLGLALVVTGTGLLKPNISTMVGQLYAPADQRRDAGFSLFYMGINLGALIAPLVTATLAQSDWFKGVLSGWGIRPQYSWHWGFAAAAVGMFFGLVWYVIDRRTLGEAGLHPAPVGGPEEAAAVRRSLIRGLVLVPGVLLILTLLRIAGILTFSIESLSSSFGVVLVFAVIAFFAWLFGSGNWTPEERKRLVVVAVLFFAEAVFWSVFEQAGSTLNLFANNNTRNVAFGHTFPSGYWQSVNSALIVIFAPVFAWIWFKLGPRNPSSPTKFALGLFFASLSFAWMIPGAMLATHGNRVGWWWLLGSYFLATVGELCLSPVGLSAMTRLAPSRVGSMIMGVWFFGTAVGEYIAGTVSRLYGSMSLAGLFASVAAYAMVFAIILALLVRPIKRMLAS